MNLMPMTGRQIRRSAIPSKVQLFPWVHAIEVVSAVPETTELDSLLGRVCLHRWPFQTRPHAATAPSWSDPSQVCKPMPGHCWPECKMPRDTCTDILPSFSFVGQGISAPLLAAAMAPLGFPSPLTPAFHFMKRSICIC